MGRSIQSNSAQAVTKKNIMSNKNKDDIPEEELETPYLPTPEGGKENRNNDKGKTMANANVEPVNNMRGMHIAPLVGGAPFGADMTWAQVQNQRQMPFPAGMFGVPPFPHMGHYPPAAAAAGNANNVAARTKNKASPKKKPPAEKKEDLRFTENEKFELMSILEQVRTGKSSRLGFG